MYLLVPLLLILASLFGITIIIWRKVPYLRKLTPEVHQPQSHINILLEFFPEIIGKVDKDQLHKYKDQWLVEAEKALRRIRLFFLRIDLASESLIKKIRKGYLNSQMRREADLTEAANNQPTESIQVTKKPSQAEQVEIMKKEEQGLIIEIAKNPKDPNLYETLGDLYVRMKNFNDAKESYEAAVELNPSKESLKLKLSQALEKVTQK